MTLVVALLAVVVVLLTVLVAGLLRSHAEILRRLHDLGAGLDDDPAVPRTLPGTPAPPATGGASRAFEGRAADVSGRGLDGGAVVLRTSGVPHDTLLLFLSSGCLTCRSFFDALADPDRHPRPADLRVVVVTRDLDEEQPATLSELVAPLAAAGVHHVSSSVAWDTYQVPGSPYAVQVHGPSGAISGEGTGADLAQVLRLLGEATGDLAFAPGAPGAPGAPRASGDGVRRPRRKAPRDAARERDTDRELLAAGIRPGDPSLYPAPTDEGSSQR